MVCAKPEERTEVVLNRGMFLFSDGARVAGRGVLCVFHVVWV